MQALLVNLKSLLLGKIKKSENQLTVKDGHVDSKSQLRVAEVQLYRILCRKILENNPARD